MKDAIIEVCGKSNDYQTGQVRVRMTGVLTGLHAADVRYHVGCKVSFMCPRSVHAASCQSSVNSTSDQPLYTAFESIMAYLSGNKTVIHNSVDLYVQEGGNILTR